MNTVLQDEISQHVPQLYRVALRILGDPDRAQDVAQETCLKALGGLKGFDGRASMSTWLHRIAVNCALTHLRQGQRPSGERIDLDGEVAEAVVARGGTPAANAEQAELQRLALGLLEALPDDCRAAFVLTQMDGYDYDTVSEILNVPRGTVASRVYRAKKILLDQLQSRTGEGKKS
jgi:RNA polymerase sigma-70 factor (ECF subfamily)